MPEYTKEQIDEAKQLLLDSDIIKRHVTIIDDGEPTTPVRVIPLSDSLAVILSALSTAEQERDTLKDQLKKYEWALAETEALVISHEGHIAKLEAKLQGTSDAAAWAEFNTLFTDSEAAELIEGLQRRVPRAMLDEIIRFNGKDDIASICTKESIDVIAAKYGVKVEG